MVHSSISKIISMPFYQQINDYYCGPAATQMALATRGVNVSQSTLASDTWLETDKYKGTVGRYIKYTLNNLLGTTWYSYKEVNKEDADLLEYRVKLNIDRGYAPVIAVYQTGKAEHKDKVLNGHTYHYLRHFVTIYGYDLGYENGTRGILYKDPIAGYSGRFEDVQPSNWISTSLLAFLIW